MDQRLETFLTVCATMNYRKAAEQLHLTQPAVTKQIQALEALYGVRLFTYDSRKLRKTAQGETLEIYAISQRYQDEELRRALKRQEKTSLRIGATKSIGDYILLPQIIRFLKEPDNELFFTVDNTVHLLAQLEGGELLRRARGHFRQEPVRELSAAQRALHRHLCEKSPVFGLRGADE